MSTFLGFESYLIPLGSTAKNVIDTIKTAITSYSWQCVRQSIQPTAYLGTFTTPSNAFTSLTPSIYVTETSSLPKWVGCQMTTPFTPVLMHIRCENPSYAPSNFTLDWSDNGTVWTTHQTWTGETNWMGSYEKRVYTVTGAPSKSYWRLNITARQSGTITRVSYWCLEDSSNNYTDTTLEAYFIPPVTETIGNSMSRELVRIAAGSNTISISPVQEILGSLPQCYGFDGPVAGAVTLSVTIGGVTVSYAGESTNTGGRNAIGLYDAIIASTDANFLAWDWKFYNNNGIYFYATTKVPSSNITISGTNITARLKGIYVPPQLQSQGFTAASTLTTDLTNGFIYYLQVNARGIALATKTNAGFYGPYHACYGVNSEAVSQVPASILSSIPMTPIELIIGYDDIATYSGSLGRTTHLWTVFPNILTGILTAETNYIASNVFTGHVFPGQLSDSMGTYGSLNVDLPLYSEGVFTGADNGTMYTVHKLSFPSPHIWNNVNGSNINGRAVGPVYNDLDWYRYVGTLSNEQLVLTASTDFSTTLTADAQATDENILVASTTGFPTAGFLVIFGEVLQYTGVTGTSFTGCTRGKYSTLAYPHHTGDIVNIGMWLVKINTGLLMSGYAPIV